MTFTAWNRRILLHAITPGEFLGINREGFPAENHSGVRGAQPSIQAAAVDCMKFLMQGGLSRNKMRVEETNKWSGNELYSNMMESINIILVSKKVIKSKENKGAENLHPFRPTCHSFYYCFFFLCPGQTLLINHGILLYQG